MNKYNITTNSQNREVIQADRIHVSQDGFIRFFVEGVEVAVFRANSVESIIVFSQENRIGFTK